MKPTNLKDHPEGGRYQEVFRSCAKVITDGGDERSALTHIYYELNPGEVSKFHRISSDEIWNLYQGEGLRLYVWDGTSKPPEIITLSAAGNAFCTVVPAGYWQAAESVSGPVLIGASVAPSFEFEDFKLMEADSPEAGRLKSFETMRDFLMRHPLV